MNKERRSHRRARIPGMRVTYEDAAGRRVESEALDVSAGGLFVPAEKIVPVGKRLSVDITLAGGSSKWSALARVIWVRERSSDAGPAGMGMKLIDSDDNLIAAIDKLVGSREPTEPGTGGSRTPSRERTVLGMGISDQSAVAATPIVTTAPAREKTQLGVGLVAVAPVKLAVEPSEPVVREESIPLELVPAKKTETEKIETESEKIETESEKIETESEVPTRRVEITPVEPKLEAEAAPLSEGSLAEAGLPRRRTGMWIAILLLLAIGGAGYAFRSRIPYATLLRALRQSPPAAPAPEPPPPTVSVMPSVTSAAPPPSVAPSGSVATRPSATASAAVSSAPSASARPGASTSARPRNPAASGSAAPSAASAAPRHSGPLSGDNPY